MSKVSNILARKGNQVAIVSPDTSVIDALKMMAEKDFVKQVFTTSMPMSQII